MAPGVYQDLWALVETASGACLLPAQAAQGARVLDWLVALRRLSPEDCLLSKVRERRLDDVDVDRLGRWLADLYGRLPRWPLSPAAYRARLQQEQAINRQILRKAPFARPHGAAQLLDQFDACLDHHAGELADRAAVLVDGHGDLRPDHVYLLDPPVVIERLELDAEARRVDPFDELGNLGQECAMAGADWVGPRLQGHLASTGAHPPSAALSRLYLAAGALKKARQLLVVPNDFAPAGAAARCVHAEAYLEQARYQLCQGGWCSGR